MAPEIGVGFANYSLRTCLGKFRMVNGISSTTDVRVIPPWLGRQSLVCFTQESPRGGEVDCWRNKFSLDPPFFILIVRICKPDDGSHEPKHVAQCSPLFSINNSILYFIVCD